MSLTRIREANDAAVLLRKHGYPSREELAALGMHPYEFVTKYVFAVRWEVDDNAETHSKKVLAKFWEDFPAVKPV